MTTYRGQSVDTVSYINDLSAVSVKSNTRINAELSEEPLEVYLRIRDRTNEETHTNVLLFPYEVEDDQHLTLHAIQNAHSKLSKYDHHYTFTRVFDVKTTQDDLFRRVGRPIVEDFIEGNNRLLFNYGVTNAGKTFTMQGNVNEPGIIPRSLDQVFHRIGSRISKIPKCKPRDGSLVKLNLFDGTNEMKLKSAILKMDSTSASTTLSNTLSMSRRANESFESSITDGSRSSESIISSGTLSTHSGTQDIKYSVWVSFVEIYSEQIFDLLDSVINKSRKTLKLRESENGSAFIQGVTEIFVSSPEEAYKLLLIGQHSLTLASTKLNRSSSRSHCIFTLKLVRTCEDNLTEINELSFCDLAGAERCSKTQNVGERLREAGIINTSLMVLGRCINNLRHNQISNQEIVVPFRDSKLTKIFKNYLIGHGKASMLINISPCMNMIDETLHVLKFSAKAKELTLPLDLKLLKDEPVTRSSITSLRLSLLDNRDTILWEENGETTRQMEESKSTLNENEESEETYLEVINMLKSRNAELSQELLRQEIEIRSELCTEFGDQLKDIEEYYRDRIAEEQEDAQETMSKRLEILADYYRSKACPDCEDRENVITEDISIQCELTEDKENEPSMVVDEPTAVLNETNEELANIIKELTNDNEKLVEANKELAITNKEFANEIAGLKEKLVNIEKEREALKEEELARAAVTLIDVTQETDVLEKREFLECGVQADLSDKTVVTSDSDSNVKPYSEKRTSLYYSLIGSSPESKMKNSNASTNELRTDEMLPELFEYVKSTFNIVTDIQQQLQSGAGHVEKQWPPVLPEIPTLKVNDFSQNTSPLVNSTELSQKKLIKKLKSEKSHVEETNSLMNTEIKRLEEVTKKLCRENEELTKKHEDSIKKNEELTKKHEDSIKKNEELTKKHEELTKKHEELAKKHEDSIEKNEDSVKINEDLAMKTEDLMKKNEAATLLESSAEEASLRPRKENEELIKRSLITSESLKSTDASNITEYSSRPSNGIGGNPDSSESSSEEVNVTPVKTKTPKKRKVATATRNRTQLRKKVKFSTDESDMEVLEVKSKGRKKLHRAGKPVVLISPIVSPVEKPKENVNQKVLRNLRKRK
ncbi:Kinesin-like protein kif20a [Chamberlinius hualienensis]